MCFHESCCHGDTGSQRPSCVSEEFGRQFRRRFISRAERLAELETYHQELLKEAEGVTEAIEELRRQVV